jgi:oxygen-independent coproporphyrinogen III oxidase
MKNKSKNIGIYIHIPFCVSKCYYCDFNSYVDKQELIPSYFNVLEHEISYYSGKLQGYSVDSIFIGGGTPSSVDSFHIARVMECCHGSFNIDEKAEISIESNPGTLTCEKLSLYRGIGINRLSIGLQAWQNKHLKQLGRSHFREDFVENMELAGKAGFENINVDLIFAVPGQIMDDWIQTIAGVVELKPSHISCYSLKIEEGTVFGDMLEKGAINPADDELDRKMYWFAIDNLKWQGFEHYEISNFAKPGSRCAHNLKYWHAQEYLGLGAGAHSYLNGVRFENEYLPEKYIEAVQAKGCAAGNMREIGKKETMNEYMMLGIRLIEGIKSDSFRHRFGEDMFAVYEEEIDRLQKKGLIEAKAGSISLTAVGLDFANQVFMEFV